MVDAVDQEGLAKAIAVQGDIGSKKDVAAMVAQAVPAFGGVPATVIGSRCPWQHS